MPRLRREETFTREVLGACRYLGWRAAHFGAAISPRGRHLTPTHGQAAGFPDICAIHAGKGHTLWAELKVPPNNTPSDNQVAWLDALAERHAGDPTVLVAVVKPAEWDRLLAYLQHPEAPHGLTPWVP